MTTESWKDFSKTLELEFKSMQLIHNPSTLQHLDKLWNKWANSVKKTANRTIPITYTVPKTHHSFSLKATKLYLALKLTNKCLHLIRNLEPPLSVLFTIQNINNIFQQISLYTK